MMEQAVGVLMQLLEEWRTAWYAVFSSASCPVEHVLLVALLAAHADKPVDAAHTQPSVRTPCQMTHVNERERRKPRGPAHDSGSSSTSTASILRFGMPRLSSGALWGALDAPSHRLSTLRLAACRVRWTVAMVVAVLAIVATTMF